MTTLFDPLVAGALMLRNRIIMAPMTRSRADDQSGVPSSDAITYYAQRASAGLIITEGTYPEARGKGYVRSPGICSEAQVAGWKAVTDAVHEAGGHIVLQLMHCGRISHPALLPEGVTPVAPSAVTPQGQVRTATGLQGYVEPRALTSAEIDGVIATYRNGARNAVRAGFDGIELHAASGYLPEQFLSSGTNRRTDRYGATLPDRARFTLDLLGAMAAEIGSDRIGIKIAPEMGINDVADAAPRDTYRYLVEQLALLNLTYLHVASFSESFDYHEMLRPIFKGTYFQGRGLTKATAQHAIAQGRADGVVFGNLYVANPDLVARFANDFPLNEPNRETYYTPGPRGYVDYPVMSH